MMQKHPRPSGIKNRTVDVLELLRWAFVSECARPDFSDKPQDREPGAVGTEYVLAQRAILGATVDTSVGHSGSHVDADTVASVVSLLPPQIGGWKVGTAVFELAMTGDVPYWYHDAVPQIEPLAWVRGKDGKLGKASVLHSELVAFTVPHPKNAEMTVTRIRKIETLWTECRWTPSQHAVQRARENYVRWWDAVDWIRGQLLTGLFDHTVTGVMPPRRPWER